VFVIKAGNTTTLIRHAKSLHPSKFREVTNQPSKQPTIEKSFQQKHYTPESDKAQVLNRYLVQMISKDLQPVSVVEDEGFQQFVHALDPKYQLPSRKTVRNKLIPELFQKETEALKQELAAASSVALTTDLWTSQSNQSFMAITAHFWCSERASLQSRVLDCARFEGSHRSPAIQEAIEKACGEFQIRNKVPTITADGAANIKKAIRDAGVSYLHCFAHAINLVVTDAIGSSPSCSQIREKVASIVSSTRRSTLEKERFEKCQETVGLVSKEPLKLLLDVPTRWNSFFIMLERALILKDAVVLFQSQSQETGMLSGVDWNIIKSLVNVLKPLHDVTTELSTEKITSLSKVIPLVNMLIQFYSSLLKTEQVPAEKQLTQNVLSQLKNRFQLCEMEHTLSMATMLDPRFKKDGFVAPERIAKTMALIKDEASATPVAAAATATPVAAAAAASATSSVSAAASATSSVPAAAAANRSKQQPEVPAPEPKRPRNLLWSLWDAKISKQVKIQTKMGPFFSSI
jgi:hypothetical protein